MEKVDKIKGYKKFFDIKFCFEQSILLFDRFSRECSCLYRHFNVFSCSSFYHRYGHLFTGIKSISPEKISTDNFAFKLNGNDL